MKRNRPKSLFDKVNAIWEMVSELPGLMKGVRREMRGLRKRMDELEHQVHSKVLQDKERQLSEPPGMYPPNTSGPWQPSGTVMYGAVDISSYPSDYRWKSYTTDQTFEIKTWDGTTKNDSEDP